MIVLGNPNEGESRCISYDHKDEECSKPLESVIQNETPPIAEVPNSDSQKSWIKWK